MTRQLQGRRHGCWVVGGLIRNQVAGNTRLRVIHIPLDLRVRRHNGASGGGKQPCWTGLGNLQISWNKPRHDVISRTHALLARQQAVPGAIDSTQPVGQQGTPHQRRKIFCCTGQRVSAGLGNFDLLENEIQVKLSDCEVVLWDGHDVYSCGLNVMKAQAGLRREGRTGESGKLKS